MRLIFPVLIVVVTSACASRPLEDDAYARAQAACGEYELMHDGPIGSREHQTRQYERRHCIQREAARNDTAGIAFRDAFNDVARALLPCETAHRAG